LLGIDSAVRPRAERDVAWRRLAELAEPSWFDEVARDIALADAIPLSSQLLAGKVRGRVVVDVNA
jgi:acrylyl-CoA reductase (NADPH)